MKVEDKDEIFYPFLSIVEEATSYLNISDDEPDMSDEFLSFLIYIKIVNSNINENFEKSIITFEESFNIGLYQYAQHISEAVEPKVRSNLFKLLNEEVILNPLEKEIVERLEILFNSTVDLEQLFKILPTFNVRTWEEFRGML